MKAEGGIIMWRLKEKNNQSKGGGFEFTTLVGKEVYK